MTTEEKLALGADLAFERLKVLSEGDIEAEFAAAVITHVCLSAVIFPKLPALSRKVSVQIAKDHAADVSKRVNAYIAGRN